MMILLIIERDDGTFGCNGPHESEKVAASYADFIGHFKPQYKFYIKKVFDVNQYGAPVYPFPTGEY